MASGGGGGGVDSDPCSIESTRTIFLTVWVIGNLFGLTVFAVILSWLLLYETPFLWSTADGLFNFHALFMVIFVIFLQANGSLVYRLTPATPKYVSKLIHAGIHLLVCAGMTFALVAIVQNHDLMDSPHFTSLHSWIGIVTVCCYYLQLICGFFAYLYPGATTDVKVRTLPVHKFIGRSLFLCAVATAVSGIMMEAIYSVGDAYSFLPQNALLLNFCGLFAVAFVVTMIYLLSEHIFRRRPQPLQYTVPGSIGQSIYYGATTSAAAFPTPTTSREKVVY